MDSSNPLEQYKDLFKGHYDLVVAMDGPSGSGKSTVAQEVAKSLNLLYVDTGAMFRALGYHFNKAGVLFDESQLKDKLGALTFEYGHSEEKLIVIDGENITSHLRTPKVSELASKISKIPCVRNYLLDRQRELVGSRFCIMEGRDIGTVVFPKSFCKIFITATSEVRAQRRMLQLKEGDSKVEVSYEKVLNDIVRRDQRDGSRDLAPLKASDDAIHLDTTTLSFSEVVEYVVNLIQDSARKISFELQGTSSEPSDQP